MTVDTLPASHQATGALALTSTQDDWTEKQQAGLAQLGLAQAPRGDLLVFLHYAQKTGLDPFARQLYMIERWDAQSGRNKYTIQAGIDGLRVIAQRTREYQGRIGPEWCGEDGVWRDFWPDRTKPPVAARCGVLRKGHTQPTFAVVHFWEFAQTKKNGDLTHMWATKGVNQIGKCAEAAALRATFPQDLSGIYTPEELGTDDPESNVEVRVNTPGQRIRDAVQQPAATQAQPASANGDARMISDAQQKKMGALMREHGLTDRDSALAFVNEVLKRSNGDRVTSRNQLTLDQAGKVIDALEREAQKSADAPVDAVLVDDEQPGSGTA